MKFADPNETPRACEPPQRAGGAICLRGLDRLKNGLVANGRRFGNEPSRGFAN